MKRNGGTVPLLRPERLSECLAAWMQEEDVSVAELTERVGYKSKTSVFRLLQDKCSDQTVQQFVRLLQPQLEESWQERFHRAAEVEQYGPEQYQIMDALDQLINRPGTVTADRDAEPRGACVLLGEAGNKTDELVDRLLREGYSVNHYMTREQILRSPALITCLFSHVTDQAYQAELLSEQPCGAWNLLATEEGRLYLNGEWYETGQDGARISLDRLKPSGGEPLYHYDVLRQGKDYISFMENAYYLERGGAAVIARHTPGIQMIPQEIVIRAFEDHISVTSEPISASGETLKRLLNQRTTLFFHRTRPLILLMIKSGMVSFMKTGIMTDQFFATRPYSMEERIQILNVLEELSQRSNVTIRIYEPPVWDCCMEAYENRGLLIYPCNTQYNTSLNAYRELFLPGQAFFQLFSDLTRRRMSALSSQTQTIRQLREEVWGEL